MSDATKVTVHDIDGVLAEYDANGKLIAGGHGISEEDYCYLQRELRGQFSCLSGRLYSLIEELGLADKQESAAKRHLKSEVWERYNDIVACIALTARLGYKSGADHGIPDDES